jgi:hypothetical protein
VQGNHVHLLIEAASARDRRHLAKAGRALPRISALDPASSGRWFEGWAQAPEPPADPPAVALARTWLLRTGWRRHGLIRPDEILRGEPGRRRT